MVRSRGEEWRWLATLVCCAHVVAILQSCAAQELMPGAISDGSGDDVAFIPTTCLKSPYVTLGSPFQWGLANGSLVTDGDCSFWRVEGNVSREVLSSEWDYEAAASQYTFYKLGDYQFSCSVFEAEVSGAFSVVTASHVVALCQECSQTIGNERKIHVSDVLRWTVESEICGHVVLQDVMTGERLELEGTGASYHVFEEPGTYEISCTEDPSIRSQITVVDGTVQRSDDEQDNERYKAVIYIHAGLMAVSFGILLPIGAYLAHHRVRMVHVIMQPLGIIIAVSGFVCAIVYVELNDRNHFDELIHGVLGFVLVILVLLVMPVLLVHKKWQQWHKKCGHFIAFFGMGNVLLGLMILPGPHAARLTVSILYGLWLLGAFLTYVLTVPLRHKDEVGDELEESGSFKTQLIELGRKGSKGSVLSYGRRGSELNGRGPKPLSKNVIREEMMIELRKKSMDPNEAQRQREELDRDLNLQPVQEAKVDRGSEPNNDFPVLAMSSSPTVYSSPTSPKTEDFPSDRDHSQATLLPLHLQLSSAPSFPVSPTSPPLHCPFHSEHRPPFHTLESSSSSESEDEREGIIAREVSAPPEPATAHIQRAHTFNVGHSHVASDTEDAHSRVGSLRITRHSRRATNKSAEDIFGQRSPRSPALRVHSPTPPDMETTVDDSATQTATAMRQKRRKRTIIGPPPIIMEPASPSPLQSALKKQPSRDDSDGRFLRRASPSPSTGSSNYGNSPRPRKKKVSVAHIEATVVPLTPVTPDPTTRFGLPSSDHNTLRVEQDVFADNALRTVMQISQDAIICANSVGEIVFWSAGAVKMFGYTPGEAIGSSLEMIIPQSFKERHRNGISRRTDDTLKYIRKHSYAPEEQKHARLYAVRGISRNGHEFPVEVNVTSFVIDDEIFYTGVITEVVQRSMRAGSVSSNMSEMSNETSLKQRAMAVGAQMKVAHQLRSVECISQRELERVLAGSFQAAKFDVPLDQMEQMVNGIMKAGDPEGSGAISFVNLIQLLSKNRLYISESGLIARYGKTKGSMGRWRAGRGNSRERRMNYGRAKFETILDKLRQFYYAQCSSIFWFLGYILLNIFLLVVGVLVTGREGWARWAYGMGPVLSMNCLLVLLPTLTSVFDAMRASRWMNLAFPLTSLHVFHILITGGIAFWSVLHILTHFTSMVIDGRHDNKSLSSSFEDKVRDHLCPIITGGVIILLFLVILLSSLRPLRRLIRFIPFYLIHWTGAGGFYLVLFLHGDHYVNPSFWKWLLPALIIVVLERLHRRFLVTHHRVTVKSAGPYDDVSRVGVIDLEKPKGFQYEAGQYMVINLPWIAYFKWHACYISSGPKDDKLTVYIPKDSDVWHTEVFSQLKSHPYKRHPVPQPDKPAKQDTKQKEEEEKREGGEEEQQMSIQMAGPFGMGHGRFFDYKISTLVCAGSGPHVSKPIIKKFLEYRKGHSCHCGCHPVLTKLYFVWVTPSGNDFEWFSDYLSDLCEDENIQRYLDIRVFLTNIDSPPDELASVLLQLGLKTAGDSCGVRRPSQPQLNNLYQMTSYGVPDFDSLLDYISTQHSNLWTDQEAEFGVFSVGKLHHTMHRDLAKACITHTKPGRLTYKQELIIT